MIDLGEVWSIAVLEFTLPFWLQVARQEMTHFVAVWQFHLCDLVPFQPKWRSVGYPAPSESQRFCSAEAVNNSIFITSPFPITNNVPPNLATLSLLAIGGMNGVDVVCQRGNKYREGKEEESASQYLLLISMGKASRKNGRFYVSLYNLIFSSPIIYFLLF